MHPIKRSDQAIFVQTSHSSRCDGADVRLGSNAEVGARNSHVRFPPDSDQTADIAGGPFRARSRSHNRARAPERLPKHHSPMGRSRGALKRSNTAISTPTLNHTPNHAEAAASSASQTASPASNALLNSRSSRRKATRPTNRSVTPQPTMMAPYRALSQGSNTSYDMSGTLSENILSPKKM
jgi:hypothetical protein